MIPLDYNTFTRNWDDSYITIQAQKYNGKLHYEWPAKLVEETEQYILVYCEAGRTFIHHSKQAIFTMPYPSLEWFYFDRGYTVAISLRPNGEMYYCNVAKPATFVGGVVSFVDLDLDYLKEVEEQWKVVDEEEFEHNRRQMGYPEETVKFAREALVQLQQVVKQGSYPFSLTTRQLESVVNVVLKG